MENEEVAEASKKGARKRLTFVFWDESGYSEKPPIRSTWGKRGVTPVITGTGSWKTLSVTGLIATDACMKRPRALFAIKRGSIRSSDTMEVLSHLLRHVKRKIMLLWDGLPAHRSLLVKNFLLRNRKRIPCVERFPAYAPELNPQEYVWSASKSKDMANFCPTEDTSLLDHTRKSLGRIRRSPDILRGALVKSGLFHGKGDV